MDTEIDRLALEHAAKSEFGVTLEVRSIIANNIDASHSAHATVFLTKKKQLYCYVSARGSLTFGDVRKILTRMKLVAELYLPPKGRPDYFDKIGTQKFREVFPSRMPVVDEDIAYYRTLAPYNPALIAIHEVKGGTIYQYDTDAHTDWRPSVKFAYRRIKTSY